MSLFESLLSILVDIYPDDTSLSHMILYFYLDSFRKTYTIFHTDNTILHIQQECTGGVLHFLHIHTNTGYLGVL
jgi:hypothetical protein